MSFCCKRSRPALTRYKAIFYRVTVYFQILAKAEIMFRHFYPTFTHQLQIDLNSALIYGVY